jgi:hypothetical protein
MTSIGQKDLFEILAAVEDYVSNEETLQKGTELLSKAMQMEVPVQADSVFRDWRHLIPHEYSSRDIVGLFRLKVTNAIAFLYTMN